MENLTIVSKSDGVTLEVEGQVAISDLQYVYSTFREFVQNAGPAIPGQDLKNLEVSLDFTIASIKNEMGEDIRSVIFHEVDLSERELALLSEVIKSNTVKFELNMSKTRQYN